MTKRPSRPVYFTVRRMVDPTTGESVGCLVPYSKGDQREMHDRKYRVGDTLRAELRKPRNVRFHRLTHALGALLVDQVAWFEGTTAHDALKRVQRECGVFCETQEIDIPALGKLQVKVAKSIAFDSMDEGDFQQFWSAVCEHVREHYFAGMDEHGLEEAIGMMEGVH